MNEIGAQLNGIFVPEGREAGVDVNEVMLTLNAQL
jgi:hypothetical protein